MKLSLITLVAAILAILSRPPLVAGRSISLAGSNTEQPARREANLAGRSLSGAQGGPEAVEEVANELALANLSIPSYLKDLYVNLTYPDGLGNKDKMEVNTIRSYENRASSVNSSCGFYKFDMEKKEIKGEDIIHAELRLLQKATLETDQYDVNIYYILREKDVESPLKLTFKHIDATPGWKTFDVTPIAQGWKEGWVNHGIQIKLIAGHHHISCDGVFYKEENEQDTEPLLVVFTHDYDSKFLEGVLKENKHSTAHTTTPPRRRRRENGYLAIHTSCELKEFIVNPEALSSGDLHLKYPNKPFNIGMCGGHCPRLQPNGATDHAVIASLQYYHSKKEAQKRCCVPTEYRQMNMMFFNSKTREFKIKKYSTAQATKCGCL